MYHGISKFSGAAGVEALTGALVLKAARARAALAAAEAATATEGRILLRNGDSLIGWVRNGELIGSSAPNTFHAVLGTHLGVVCDGAALEGAQAFTIIKEGGKISVFGSSNFGGVLNISDEVIKVVTAIFH